MITANAKRRERDIESVEFIAANGPITASQLANRLRIPPQTAHRILARLKSEMLCKGHKEYGKPAEWDLSEHAIKPRGNTSNQRKPKSASAIPERPMPTI